MARSLGRLFAAMAAIVACATAATALTPLGAIRNRSVKILSAFLLTAVIWWAIPAGPATAYHFSTGDADGKIASGSRPASPGKSEIESADDFVLTDPTTINHATFTGLVTGAAPTTDQVVVEIYRVFPKDSTFPPSGMVPTRVNSPSDDALGSRDSGAASLTFTTMTLTTSFTASNSVLNGINKVPNQQTGGEGPVTGKEVLFGVTFTTPFVLDADHYFFVPQVKVTGGEFFWLSAPKPIVSPGTPFAPDLQSWIRNENLAPDWLRIGMDIVGGSPAPTFNAVFSLDGEVAPTQTPTATPTQTPTATQTGTPQPNGAGCAAPVQCTSGNCVDAVCCDTPCDRPLQACNLAGRVGTCASTAAPVPAMSTRGLVAALAVLGAVGALAFQRRARRRHRVPFSP